MADNATLKAIAFSAALAGGEYYDQTQSYKVPDIVEPQTIVKEVVKVKHLKFEEAHHKADKHLRESINAVGENSTNSDVVAYIKKIENDNAKVKATNKELTNRLSKTNTALKQYVEATK